MMVNKLISMVDFVLSIDNVEPKAVNFASITDIRNYQLQYYSQIVNYANFLKQPLKLGMFVPCDDDNKIYKSYLSFNHSIDDKNGFICEPYEGLFEIDANKKCSGWKYLDPDKTRYYDAVSYEEARLKYQQAKDRVLFDGFDLLKDNQNHWYFSYKNEEEPHGIIKETTVEYLSKCYDDLTLTASAIKQFEL